MKLIILFSCLLLIPVSAYAYNSGFQPVYQPNLPPGGVVSIHDIGNVTSTGCAVNQVLQVNASGIWVCYTLAGTGEINTASSSGLGQSLVLAKNVFDLPFKGLAVSGDLTISSNSTDVTIGHTASGGGNATILNDLGDVVTAPTFGEVLYYDGNTWIDHILILQQDISDVVITLAERGDFLFYDGSNWIDKIFSINTQSATNGNFVTGVNNQTGVITTQTFKVNNQTVSANTYVQGINNVTGVISTATISASGEANTMSSPTKANTLVLTKSGVDLPIKGIACSGSATCSANTTDVTITATGLSDGDKTDITVSASGATWTIDNDVVTYAKMQNVVNNNRFHARISGANGDIEEITGTQATTLLDTFTSALKGLVPLSGGGTSNFLRADGTWAAPSAGGMTTMKKTADQTINAGAAVYTDITDLSFPVTNGVDYAFHYYIVFRSSATTTGFKCSVNGPAGTVDYFMTYQTVANAASGAAGVATWLQAHQIVYDAGFLNLTTITANADLVCIIDGRYKSTADGTFTARFANELAANTNIVVQKGSYGWVF